MSKYNVTFTETAVYTISVDANNEDEASENAHKIANKIDEDLFSNFNNACVEWATYPSDERIEEVKDND